MSAWNSTNNTFDIFCTSTPVGPLIWAGFGMFFACVGLPASAWLLWVLLRGESGSLSNNTYVLNLTIMDLIFNLFILPGVLNYFVWRNYVVYFFMMISSCFNVYGRPLFMSCICVDGYMAVVSPITYMRIKNTRYRVVLTGLIWVSTLFIGIWSYHTRSYHILLLTGLTAPVMTYCCISILYALNKPDPSGNAGIHPQKQRALQIVTNSLFVSLVSYVPTLLICGFSMAVIDDQEVLYCLVLYPSILGCLLGSTIMPLLYLGNLGFLPGTRALKCW